MLTPLQHANMKPDCFKIIVDDINVAVRALRLTLEFFSSITALELESIAAACCALQAGT